MFSRSRITAIAVALSVLSVAAPVASARAATGPSIANAPIAVNLPSNAPALLAPGVPAGPNGSQAGLQAALDGWQAGLQAGEAGLQAGEAGWQAGAQAAQSGWQAGIKAGQAGFTAGLDALGLPTGAGVSATP